MLTANQLLPTCKGMPTLLSSVFIIIGSFLCCSALQAQTFTFPVDAGPYNVVAGTATQVCFNDAGNTAGVPAGPYGSFIFTADWTAGGGDPYSSEAEITVTTAGGSSNVDPPTAGSTSNGNPTNLEFTGILLPGYDPTIDGSICVDLDQSFPGSDANWSNLTLTLGPSLTPATVATITSAVCDDSDVFTATTAPNEVVWLEIVYDGMSNTLVANTFGSSYDTEIGLYNSAGILLIDDDDSGGVFQSEVSLIGLPAGTYYVAVGGFNTEYFEPFNVVGGGESGDVTITVTTGCDCSDPCNEFCTTSSVVECDGDPCTTGDVQVLGDDGSECSCTPGAVDMASCDPACTTTMTMECDGDPTTVGDVLVLAADGTTCSCSSGGSAPTPAITCPPAVLDFCDGTYDCMFMDNNPATDGNGVTDDPIIGGTAAAATDNAGIIDLTQLSPGGTYTITLNYDENGTLGTEVSCTFTLELPNDADGGRF